MRPAAALVVFLAAPAPGAQPAPRAAFEQSVAPFLTRYCTACHNTKAKTANLDLERLRNPAAALAERDAWETVAQKVRSGQMPPPGLPKPDPAGVRAVVDWADRQVARLDRSRPVDPGRVTARRLNRAEYNNTVRDLFGIDFRPADSFPLDDSGHGFDNNADVLTVSPLLLEKYLEAAEQIVRVAIAAGPRPRPVADRYEAERWGESRQVPADPEGERLTRRGALVVRHRFTHEAGYDIRVGVRDRGGAGPASARLVLVAGGRQVEVVDVQSGAGQRRVFEIRARVGAGEREVGGAFVAAPEEGRFAVDFVEVRGPFFAQDEPPPSHQRIFVCTERTEECARRILAGFGRRAWRRPLAPGEIDAVSRLFAQARSEGASFEESIQLAVKAMLVSPHFLFRIERNPPAGQVRPLDDFELASRLSYFLWSSLPDETLLELAERRTLSQPATLALQVKRMLADPRAEALAENFAGQWLELRNLASVSPDPKRFPHWDADLREAMRRETLLFFSAVLREDRSILDFIDGRFTFLNERLARHYGVTGVEGRKFRRVELAGDQRSGVLTHASVLTVSSYPTRTSPVLRGLWVLENFLASPPPAPPANVPQLAEDSIGVTMSLRQQLERHRADPACAVCHIKMDALGFGLENYDATGAWRTHDGKFPVDSTGALPGAQSFTTPAEMKAILRADAALFTRCLTEKLMTYALGRGIESADKPVIRAIADKTAGNGHRLAALILAIVQSPPFRQRRGEAPRS